MNSSSKSFSAIQLSQFGIFISVNSLFILKYFSRYSNHSLILLSIYVTVISTLCWGWTKLKGPDNKNFWKYSTLGLASLISILILILLYKIDRYSVRVDRWSAVTFFLDALFRGEYPYAAHTHVCATNFASPFPIWHLINIPFYLLGDVGYGLIFFLIITIYSLVKLTNGYKHAFIFIGLLFLSPAYWWEVSVRSDSLSNGLLVFNMILLYYRKGYNLSNKLGLSIILCGLIASTRLSAILPLALFFFHDYSKLSLKNMILFPMGILTIVFIMFSPFIFWDTEKWIFFHRNPFMSQTSIGNSYILILMMLVGIYFSFKVKNQLSFFALTSSFIFLFIFFSLCALVTSRGITVSFFADPIYDISYFTLAFPYTIMYLAMFSYYKYNQNLTSSI